MPEKKAAREIMSSSASEIGRGDEALLKVKMEDPDTPDKSPE